MKIYGIGLFYFLFWNCGWNFLTYIFELLTFSKTTLPKLKCWIQWIEQVKGSSPVKAATLNFFLHKIDVPQKSQIIELSIFFNRFLKLWFFSTTNCQNLRFLAQGVEGVVESHLVYAAAPNFLTQKVFALRNVKFSIFFPFYNFLTFLKNYPPKSDFWFS